MFALENLFPGPYFAALWFYVASAAAFFVYLPIHIREASRLADGSGLTTGECMGKEGPAARAASSVGRLSAACGIACNAWVFAAAWSYFGRPPLQTINETLVYCAGACALLFLLMDAAYRIRLLGGPVMLAPAGMLVWNLAAPSAAAREIPPALRSTWFVPHVAVYMAAYGAMAITFAMAVAALAAHYLARRDLWAGVFRRWSDRAARVAFPLLTAGLCIGAVWAKSAWGDFWSWDPKESWSLASWLFYLIYFHIRAVPGWAGTRSQWLLTAGILVILFTYVGVSRLPSAESSLHVFETSPAGR
ncbi:MAG: cytochrome c biogenesis protein CcsA [Planctomycetota bacterium]|nr:cytochrome c biogenesis protein CcsA [Planctomycetota bacterium]